jgi:hypothetical protein
MCSPKKRVRRRWNFRFAAPAGTGGGALALSDVSRKNADALVHILRAFDDIRRFRTRPPVDPRDAQAMEES